MVASKASATAVPMGARRDLTLVSRRRVLVLASTFPRWAGDTEPPFIFNLCRSLRHAFDFTVLAPHAAGARTIEQMDGLSVHRFRYFWPAGAQRLAYGGMLPNLKRNPWLWFQAPFFMAAELVEAIRLIRSEDIDVIHAHWLLPQGLVAAIAGLLTGRPVVLTTLGADVYGLQGKWTSRIKRWVLRRMTRITALSRDLAQAVEGLADSEREPVAVIGLGVDTHRFKSRRDARAFRAKLGLNGPMLLFVGRLAEKKGVRYLLAAMPAVLAQHPNATLVIIGDGPLRGELTLQARDLGLGESVRFLGARQAKELPNFYTAADAFAGPSIVAAGGDTESFGVVFAEAMACGCPVVASDVGGVSDLVKHERTGLMVPQRDPDALAQALCRLLEDEGLARRLRRNGRAHVKRHFSEAAIAENYETVLREAAA